MEQEFELGQRVVVAPRQPVGEGVVIGFTQRCLQVRGLDGQGRDTEELYDPGQYHITVVEQAPELPPQPADGSIVIGRSGLPYKRDDARATGTAGPAGLTSESWNCWFGGGSRPKPWSALYQVERPLHDVTGVIAAAVK